MTGLRQEPDIDAGPGDVSAARASDMLAAARLLWPEPAVVGFAKNPPAGWVRTREFLLVPTSSRPRLAAPASSRRAAAAATARYSAGLPPLRRASRRLLSLLLPTGLPQAVMRRRLVVDAPAGVPCEGIDDVLSAALGSDVLVAMRLGSLRANRKPVLQVLDRSGRTLAYAKVGHNEFARELVRAERAALDYLSAASLDGVVVPQPTAFVEWKGLEVLVLAPVPISRASWPADPPAHAMSVVAAVDGLTEKPLAASTYWRRMLAVGERLTDPVIAESFRTALGTIGDTHAERTLVFGAWHGDWAPWNMSLHDDSVVVWDWERFERDVPVGLDALHYTLQTALAEHGGSHHRAAPAWRAGRGRALDALGVPADDQLVTVQLYLLELAARYAVDAERPTGAVLRDALREVLAVLAEEVAR